MAENDIKVLKENSGGSYDEVVLNNETLITGKMTNPMTAAGDLIYGGTSGTPTKLVKGTAGKILAMNNAETAPEWILPPASIYPFVYSAPSWSTSDFTNYANGTGSVTFYQTNGYVNGSTSAADDWIYCAHGKRFKELSSIIGNTGSYNKIVYSFAFSKNNLQEVSATDCKIFVGFHHDLTNAVSTTNVTRTTHHIGIFFSRVSDVTTCYCSSGNGTTTETAITNFHGGFITAVHTAGVDVKFYVNGSLVATHTTNLPSFQSTHGCGIGMSQQGTGSASIHLSHFSIYAINDLTTSTSGVAHSHSFTITNPTATADRPLWRVPRDITITAIHVLSDAVIVGNLYEYDSNGLNGSSVDTSDITTTANTNTNDDGSLNNAAIASGNYLGWKTTSVSGTPTWATITFEYY